MAVQLVGQQEQAQGASPELQLTRRAHTRRPSLKIAIVATDATAILLSMYVAYRVGQVHKVEQQPVSAAGYTFFALASLPLWLAVFARYGLYSSRRVTSRSQEYRQLFHAIVIGVALIMLGAYAFQLEIARRWVLLTLVFVLLFTAIERELVRRAFVTLRKRGRMMRPILLVGVNTEGRAIADMCGENPGLGYHVVGFIDDQLPADPTVPWFGTTADALSIVRAQGATGVVIATSAIDAELCNELARELVEAGVHVELSSTLRDIASQRLMVRPLGRYPVVCLEPVRRAGWRGAAKRAWDIVIALAGLVLLSPLIALIAALIKLDSPGPAFFRQLRTGKDGVLFTIVKFRTMASDAELRLAELEAANEADGPLFKMRNDPRVTRVGRVLRRWSLDELPQLWNVLRGEMSMVGPRPALPSEAAVWPPRLRQRLRVKPGLTGMWQVHGRSDASFEQYERLDLYYVDNWSLFADLFIILRTIPVLLHRKGAY